MESLESNQFYEFFPKVVTRRDSRRRRVRTAAEAARGRACPRRRFFVSSASTIGYVEDEAEPAQPRYGIVRLVRRWCKIGDGPHPQDCAEALPIRRAPSPDGHAAAQMLNSYQHRWANTNVRQNRIKAVRRKVATL